MGGGRGSLSCLKWGLFRHKVGWDHISKEATEGRTATNSVCGKAVVCVTVQHLRTLQTRLYSRAALRAPPGAVSMFILIAKMQKGFAADKTQPENNFQRGNGLSVPAVP